MIAYSTLVALPICEAPKASHRHADNQLVNINKQPKIDRIPIEATSSSIEVIAT